MEIVEKLIVCMALLVSNTAAQSNDGSGGEYIPDQCLIENY